jgi:hypothetical protein
MTNALGAAEFYYRAGDRAWGDAILETMRGFTPQTGLMSEFDGTSGD